MVSPFPRNRPRSGDPSEPVVWGVGANCARGLHVRTMPWQHHQLMLPGLSPGRLFLFCPLCWRFTRKLIPRLQVVWILVDPVEQLFTAWLLPLGR